MKEIKVKINSVINQQAAALGKKYHIFLVVHDPETDIPTYTVLNSTHPNFLPIPFSVLESGVVSGVIPAGKTENDYDFFVIERLYSNTSFGRLQDFNYNSDGTYMIIEK
jgi:hypothetical protein